MCGIAGWIGDVKRPEETIEHLKQRLRHRGPDEQGHRRFRDGSLVHTRLRILDLSPTGSQPMSNEDGTVWTVFNGEIYNHKSLRRDLESRGHLFRGTSDTEIIPHLYEEQGAGFLDRLRGMFAIAVYDTRSSRLLLARDRFGIKPLFFAPGAGFFAFASELNALREVPGVNLDPDTQSVYDFTSLFYIPAPETFYRGIRSLEPGQLAEARIEDGTARWKVRKFFSWKIHPDFSLNADKAVDRAEELLSVAVQRQLESDVPLGAFLSGGIDSSLVCAFAQRQIPEGVRTYNVKFDEEEFDETWAALAVARHIGSNHTTLNLQRMGTSWEYITGLLSHCGQPYADQSMYGVESICGMMREHLTVALSGDGGDEGFGGYETFWRVPRKDLLRRMPDALLRAGAGLAGLAARLGLPGLPHPVQLTDNIAIDRTTFLERNFTFIRQEELERLWIGPESLRRRRFFEQEWEIDLGERPRRVEELSARLSEIWIRLVLPNDFLFKTDIASMNVSLEVRVPLLDEDVFSFGLSLPHRLKVRGKTGKYVLRGLARRLLPPEITHRPKRGFSTPVVGMVDDDFRERLRNRLLDPASRLRDYFDQSVYAPWVHAFIKRENVEGILPANLYRRTMMLLALSMFLDPEHE